MKNCRKIVVINQIDTQNLVL